MLFNLATRKWLSTAKSLCREEDIKEFSLNNLGEEIDMLEKELYHDSQEIGFCHNDLQYGNIMMDEETRSITIIVSLPILYVKFFYIMFLLLSTPQSGNRQYDLDTLTDIHKHICGNKQTSRIYSEML